MATSRSEIRVPFSVRTDDTITSFKLTEPHWRNDNASRIDIAPNSSRLQIFIESNPLKVNEFSAKFTLVPGPQPVMDRVTVSVTPRSSPSCTSWSPGSRQRQISFLFSAISFLIIKKGSDPFSTLFYLFSNFEL